MTFQMYFSPASALDEHGNQSYKLFEVLRHAVDVKSYLPNKYTYP